MRAAWARAPRAPPRNARGLAGRPCTCGLSRYMPRCDGSHARAPDLSLAPAFVRASAERLAAANVARRVLALTGPGAPEGEGDFSVARAPRSRGDALAFTAALARAMARAGAGGTRAGYKVGGTDGAPFFGPIFARDVRCAGTGAGGGGGDAAHAGAYPAGFLVRGVEVELAATLRAALPARAGGDYSPDEAADAVGAWAPALEVCGARVAPPAGRAVPAWLRVADAASHGALLVGDAGGADWARFARGGGGGDDAPVRLLAAGAEVARGGPARLVRGSPAAALAWLANELNRLGLPPLAAGDIVTTGTLTGLTEVARSAPLEATFQLAGGRHVLAAEML